MQLESGLDSRSNCWLWTSDRWAESDVYIALPVNPSSLEVSNPIRGTQGETQRGKFMYVHRNPISKSVIAPCTYSFEIPSGFILPQFSNTYIKEAQELVRDFAVTQQAIRNSQQTDSDTSTDQVSDTTLVRQNAVAVNIGNYRAGVKEFMNAFPSQDQTCDYRSGSPSVYREYQGPGDRNIPRLYVPDVPIGIQNFYAFLMLAEEPRVFTDSSGRIRNNRIIIHFNSLDLPAMTFWGWWDQGGISYSEDIDDYGQFNINFSIFVTGSSPALGYNHFGDLINTYKAEIASPSTSLDRLRSILAEANNTPTPLYTPPSPVSKTPTQAKTL